MKCLIVRFSNISLNNLAEIFVRIIPQSLLVSPMSSFLGTSIDSPQSICWLAFSGRLPTFSGISFSPHNFPFCMQLIAPWSSATENKSFFMFHFMGTTWVIDAPSAPSRAVFWNVFAKDWVAHLDCVLSILIYLVSSYHGFILLFSEQRQIFYCQQHFWCCQFCFGGTKFVLFTFW